MSVSHIKPAMCFSLREVLWRNYLELITPQERSGEGAFGSPSPGGRERRLDCIYGQILAAQLRPPHLLGVGGPGPDSSRGEQRLNQSRRLATGRKNR